MTDRELAIPVEPGPRMLIRALNIAGVAIVGFLLVRDSLLERPLWVVILAGVALLGWLLRELLLRLRLWWSAVPLLVSVAASSAIAVPTSVLGFVPGIICLAGLIASAYRSVWLGLSTAVGSAAVISLSAVLLHAQPGAVFGSFMGLVLAVLVGISRRQFRVAAIRDRELLEERLRLGEERAHTAAFAERSRIARDIHDVLAHSLGGLVLQLDAIDALLESGRPDDAHARVTAARGLAASGLEEARRAVDALRDPDAAADLAGSIRDLVATHRSLGALAELHESGEPGSLSDDAAGALRRAAQEALSNARRHAPGQPTTLSLAWTADAATLTASTQLVSSPNAPTPGSASGGGRGLLGLRERVEALGGTADWRADDGSFVVRAEVPR